MIGDYLSRYYEACGDNLTYTTIRSIMIDGHEVAWMRFDGRIEAGPNAGQPFSGYTLMCECNFKEGVGWKVNEKFGTVNLMGPDSCLCRRTACSLCLLEIKREYKEKFGEFLFEHNEEIIFDLITKVKAGEFIGEDGNGASFWGGYFYLQTLAAIVDCPMQLIWEDIEPLIKDKKISLEGAVVQDYREPLPPEWEEYLRIEDHGVIGTASLPTNGDMPQQWKLEIFDGDEDPVDVEYLDLLHQPVFGPDVDDVGQAENHLRMLIDIWHNQKTLE